MGYYVSMTDSNCLIPSDKLDDAYKAMCALNADDSLKRGGCFGGTPRPKPADSTSVSNNPDKWFSWMPWNYDEVFTSAEKIFEELGFITTTVVINDKEYLSIQSYDDKTGAEDEFLKACAPFIEPGSYIVWRGEDEEMWVDIFDGESTFSETNHPAYPSWPLSQGGYFLWLQRLKIAGRSGTIRRPLGWWIHRLVSQ